MSVTQALIFIPASCSNKVIEKNPSSICRRMGSSIYSREEDERD